MATVRQFYRDGRSQRLRGTRAERLIKMNDR